MGGEHSGCDEATTDVLIESALWDPQQHRPHRPQARHRHRRALSLRARRRSRFLRPRRRTGDATGASTFAAASRRSSSSPAIRSKPRQRVAFPYSEVEAADRPRHRREPKARRSSTGSASSVDGGEVDRAELAPRHRGQGRHRRADRAHRRPRPRRLDAAAARTPACRAPVLTLLQKRTRTRQARARRARPRRGGDVVVHRASRAAELFGGGKPALALANPIAADLSDMRPSLVPGLSPAAERNARRGFGDVALFEVGPDLPRRRRERSAHRGGGAPARPRQGARRGPPLERRRRRSTCSTPRATRWRCSPRSACRRAPCRSSPGGPAFLHPGRSATLQFGPKNIVGWFGELHPGALEALDAEGPLVAFEIAARRDPAPKARPTKAKPKLERSEFMPVERDLAFVVGRRRARGRHPQGGARRRPRADHRRRRVRRLSRPRRAGRHRNRSRSR